MIPAEISGIHFTNVERFLLEKLSDGKAHTIADLTTWDVTADVVCLRSLIYNIRKKIISSRYRIYQGVEVENKTAYRLVTLVDIPALH